MSDPLFVALVLLLTLSVLTVAEVVFHRSETEERHAARVLRTPHATAG